MNTFETLFPIPTGGRNADDMGMPPSNQTERDGKAVQRPVDAVAWLIQYTRAGKRESYATDSQREVDDHIRLYQDVLVMPLVEQEAAYVAAFMDGLSWMEANRDSRPGEWREAALGCASARIAETQRSSSEPASQMKPDVIG